MLVYNSYALQLCMAMAMAMAHKCGVIGKQAHMCHTLAGTHARTHAQAVRGARTGHDPAWRVCPPAQRTRAHPSNQPASKAASQHGSKAC